MAIWSAKHAQVAEIRQVSGNISRIHWEDHSVPGAVTGSYLRRELAPLKPRLGPSGERNRRVAYAHSGVTFRSILITLVISLRIRIVPKQAQVSEVDMGNVVGEVFGPDREP